MKDLIRKTQQAAIDFDEERTYFLPNHNVRWLDRMASRTKGEILIVGGTLYGCYLAKEFEVDVVERSPLAALGQLYVVWLINKGFSLKRIKQGLLLNKFGDRKLPHSRYTDYCLEEYQKVLDIFLKFLDSDKKTGERLFRKIFKVTVHGNRYGVNLLPKGLTLGDFETQYPLSTVRDLFLEDIRNLSSKRKYNRIITSNTIDFFEDKDEFLSLVKKLVAPEGFVEVTTYNLDTAIFLKGKEGSGVIIEGKIGEATLLTKTDEDFFIEYQEDLVAGKNTFLLHSSNL